MKIELKEISIRELSNGYEDNNEDGVAGGNGASANQTAAAGTTNTGNGARGAGVGAQNNAQGAAGGSGVVVLKYKYK